MSRTALVLAAISIFGHPVCAQEAGDANRPTPFARLKNAPPKFHTFALVHYIESRLAAQAEFEGQYADLRKLEWDVVERLRQWIKEPPIEAEDRWRFQVACIDAIRDAVTDKPKPNVMATLSKIADEKYGGAAKTKAAFALAQFGDRQHVEKMIAQLEALTRHQDLSRQCGGWQRLANLHSKMRQHGEAVKAFKRMFAIIDGSKLRYPPRFYAGQLYNAGCAMAKAGQTAPAFLQIEKALEFGAKNRAQLPRKLLLNDMDIASLRADKKRFAAMMAKYYGNERR